MICRIFRYFYSSEFNSSENQIREDFREFPPKPLNCDSLIGDFKTIRVRSLGEHIHTTILMKRLVEGAVDMDSLSLTIKNEMRSEIANFELLFGRSAGIGKKIFFWIGLGVVFFASSLKLTRPTHLQKNP